MGTRPRSFSRSGESLYLTMGLEKSCSAQDVKKAYRRLALKYHPDKNIGDPTSTDKFKEVNYANVVLSDNTKRGIYDRYGSLGLYVAEHFGEENVNTYFVLTSGWCKALMCCSFLLTGCCFCCCCFCCFNFCCGKFKPQPPEDDYANLHTEEQNDAPVEKKEEYSDTPEDSPTHNPDVVTSQPGSANQTDLHSGHIDESTELTQERKPTYGSEDLPASQIKSEMQFH